MGDVEAACVVEIKSGDDVRGRARAGLEIRSAIGGLRTAAPQPQHGHLPHVLDVRLRGRPAVPLITVLGELIDASSVGGAVFDLGSAAFDMTRIVTGQLDAYVDVGTRMIEEVPALRAQLRAGRRRRGAEQLALRPGGAGPVPGGGRRPSSPTPTGSRSAAGRCSAPATSSRCRAWRPRTRSCTTGCWRSWSAGFARLRGRALNRRQTGIAHRSLRESPSGRRAR